MSGMMILIFYLVLGKAGDAFSIKTLYYGEGLLLFASIVIIALMTTKRLAHKMT